MTVLVHRMLVGNASGGLMTVIALALILHPSGSERLVVAGLLQVVATSAIMLRIQNPGEPRPLTWAKAITGALLVAGLALLAFGSVPHEWITYADAELGWGRRDLILINLPVLPFDISRMAVRDIIAAGIYTNSFAAALAIWLMWQRRFEWAEERAKERGAEPQPIPAGTSAYGRPLTKQA